MMGRSKRKSAAINTLVGAETSVSGDIDFSGGCLIDGEVVGNVTASKDSNSLLNVSERGRIEGTVTVPNITLNGTVRGDVRATERIELGPKSRVIGNVQYRLIEMAIGAEVNGKLIHESEGSGGTPAKPVEAASVNPNANVKAIGE